MKFNNIYLLILVYIFAFNSYLPAQIRIKAVGDIMPGSITPVKIIPPDSGRIFVESIGAQLKDADIRFGNFEGAVIEQDWKPCKCSDSSRRKERCFEFGIPRYEVQTLKLLGFNVLNNDNNHSSDYGVRGLKLTRAVLENEGIKCMSPATNAEFFIKGKNIVFIPFSFEEGSYKISDIDSAIKIIKHYKTNTNLVIVSFHGGAEGQKALHIKDNTEMFLGENRGNVVQFAHKAIDAGATAVIGHGPHVLRAMELYKGKLIAYSLGNFLNYGNFNLKNEAGYSVILTFDIENETGNFLQGYLTPVYQEKPGIPYYDNNKKGIKLIQSLTKSDIFDTGLIISDDGILNIRK